MSQTETVPVKTISPNSTGGRKLRIVDISPEFLLDLVKIPPQGEVRGDFFVACNEQPIPEDATALRCGINTYGGISMVIESDSFDIVEESKLIPKTQPMYERKLVK